MVSLDAKLLGWVDGLVSERAYESRSAALEAGLESLHRKRMDEQFEAALAALSPEDIAEEVALAELGVDEWFRELDAEDGGWGSEEAVGAAR